MGTEEMVENLVRDGVLQTPIIREAFLDVNRADFVLADQLPFAYDNVPLPIGEGQTISQPWTVAFMLELLQPGPGHNILDIGSGSGWQTALLAHIVSQGGGHVTALEIVPELCERSQASLHRYGFIEQDIVEVHCQDAHEGWPARAPYDRMVAAAMTDTIPPAWLEQLVSGGILVLPMKAGVWKVSKDATGIITQEEYSGFSFVPFVH